MYERFNLAFCGKILGMEIPWEFLQLFPWCWDGYGEGNQVSFLCGQCVASKLEARDGGDYSQSVYCMRHSRRTIETLEARAPRHYCDCR